MSLLSEAMENCIFMVKSKVEDGYGGYIDSYAEGVPFKAAVSYDVSMQARIAQQEGVKNLYTITTRKDFILDFHDVIKRSRDGKVFQVTSDGADHATPASASLNMRVVSAKEFTIPAIPSTPIIPIEGGAGNV